MGKHSHHHHHSSEHHRKHEDGDKKLVASDDELFSKDNDEEVDKNEKEAPGLITYKTIQACPSEPLEPDGISGFIVANIPVIISEFQVEIDCEITIELDYPAIEIKRVKKNVFITQCRLLPKAKKLFIKGFIRKNIEYAAVKVHDSKGGCSIRHMTFRIPFACATEIDYCTLPLIKDSCCSREIEIYISEPCEQGIPEKSSESFEYYNERIYCRPVMAKVNEIDIIGEKDKKGKDMEDKTFRSLVEKITLRLRLKLMQNQDVNIYSKFKKSF